MRAFSCANCGSLVYFENSACLRCGTALGFDPEQRTVVLAGDGRRRCANQIVAACNWLVADGGAMCRCCRLTRTRPNDGDGTAMVQFRQAEAAKRRLIFQLLELGLPVGDETPTFDLLTSHAGPVFTGHEDGVITINLAETEDSHRERLRAQLGEPYRTMLGHFRHEIGHYYWPLLIHSDAALEECRALFGDERANYQDALDRHYRDGPAVAFVDRFVSAYATMHPWEDWAETLAHYLHIRDTLQTAAAYGMIVTGPVTDPPSPKDASLMAAPAGADPRDFADVLTDWLPLTYALNAVNRSMGKDDLYPFVLAPLVIDKLAFVHRLVAARLTPSRPSPRWT